MAIHHLSLLMVVVMVVLCLAMNHVPPSMQQDEKPPEPSVKDILTELKSGKRYVFAAGFDGTKMLLFISGNEASIAFGSGLQVENPGEPVNGSFAHLEKAKNLSKYPSAKFSADELVFAVKDSKGIELVGMSKQGVNVLSLSSGSFDHLKIEEDINIENCYRRGALHISSSDASTFYVLDSKGNLGRVNFDNVDSVVLSKTCLEYPFGHLCYQGKKMTLSDTCKDPPPKDIVSGLVTSGSAYLFTKTGDLYLFSASLFKQSSGSVDVTVVKAEEAWPTGGSGGGSSHRPPNGNSTSESSATAGLPLGAILGGVFVAILALVAAIVVFFYCKRSAKPKKKEEGQKDKDKKTKKKSQKKKKKQTTSPSKNRKSTSKSKAGGHASSRKNASPKVSSSKSAAAASSSSNQ